jgi:large subunit ribosomal protein L13
VKTIGEQNNTVIDASELILGRMASIVAKRLLSEESIVIINAEKAALSGKRLSRVKKARAFLEIGHPRKGPFHPRRPDQIVRRTIRGMLPHRQPRGSVALKRLRVFLGLPIKFRNVTVQSIPEAHVSRLNGSYLTLGDLAKEIGYKKVGE